MKEQQVGPYITGAEARHEVRVGLSDSGVDTHDGESDILEEPA